MTHFKMIELLNSLAEAKQIMSDLKEYDDYDVIELLEMKYEKIYRQLTKN